MIIKFNFPKLMNSSPRLRKKKSCPTEVLGEAILQFSYMVCICFKSPESRQNEYNMLTYFLIARNNILLLQ